MHPLEFLFVVALLFYSFVIWTHRFKKELSSWMVWLFGIGLAADISGTIFLCVQAAARWTWTLHTISGVASLAIMAVHFAWAVLAITRRGEFEKYFNRFSISAWSLWLVAFISGIPHS